MEPPADPPGIPILPLLAKRTNMRFAAIACALLCAACGPKPPFQAYPGPQLPPDQHAQIAGMVETDHKVLSGLNEVMMITCVDGVSTRKGPHLAGRHPYPTVAFVTPGRHYVGVMWGVMNTFATGALWLDAEAGRTYRINRAAQREGVRIWLTDATTGSVVGGIVGGEPNAASDDRNCSRELHQG